MRKLQEFYAETEAMLERKLNANVTELKAAREANEKLKGEADLLTQACQTKEEERQKNEDLIKVLKEKEVLLYQENADLTKSTAEAEKKMQDLQQQVEELTEANRKLKLQSKSIVEMNKERQDINKMKQSMIAQSCRHHAEMQELLLGESPADEERRGKRQRASSRSRDSKEPRKKGKKKKPPPGDE